MIWKFHTFFFVLCVVIGFGVSKSLACSCNPPTAKLKVVPTTYNTSNGKYYVLKGENATYDASESFDLDCQNCSECGGVSMKKGIKKFEWDWDEDGNYDYDEEPGDGKAQKVFYTTGERKIKVKVHDDDNSCCCSGPTCSDKTATKEITVVVVDLTGNAPSTLLAYINEEAGNQPTKTATATGSPAGGSYSWSWTSQGGSMEFVSGQYSATTTIRGTWWGDVTLKVTYALDGMDICYATGVIKVQRISTTNCFAGVLDESDPDRKTRNYYHQLFDQDGDLIDVVGVPCKEWVYDMTDNLIMTSSATTGTHASDGDWNGGISQLDILSWPCGQGSDQRKQLIKAGGWATSPWYYLWFDLGEEDVIWKEAFNP